MNVIKDNEHNTNEFADFTPVQRKKSRFNSISQSAPNAPIKATQNTIVGAQNKFIDNSPIPMQELGTRQILFKRKQTDVIAPYAPIKKKEEVVRDTTPVVIESLEKKVLFVKKVEEPIINNIKLFPDLNKSQAKSTLEENKPEKVKTVWNTFKPSQLDISKTPSIIPSTVKQSPSTENTVVKKVNSSTNSDDEYSNDEYDDYSDESYEEEYEETLLETLHYRQEEILEKLEELEENSKTNTRMYRDLEIELSNVEHDIHLEEYYQQQTDNEMYKNLNDALYGNLNYALLYKEDPEVVKKKKELDKENEMRERKARIDILGYDDYDQFKFKLEEDLRKLRYSGSILNVN
jgi:hypothetical protein